MIEELESEAIYIIREVMSQSSNPGILFSGGKDSIVLVHLAQKACYPAKLALPLIHIDTGHNFDETIAYRDAFVNQYNLKLIVGEVEAYIASGEIIDEEGIGATRNFLQSHVLLQTLENHQIDAAIGGGRRDEEKARAKERVFSHRDEFGQWDPKNQRPELWNIFNTKKRTGESFRVFPLSNWTEQDVWEYIISENIDLPPIYYAHERKVFNRDGSWLAASEFNPKLESETEVIKMVRCRTIGDITCTGMWESQAKTNRAVLEEIIQSEYTERGSRTDDKKSETSMEDRKRDGYF